MKNIFVLVLIASLNVWSQSEKPPESDPDQIGTIVKPTPAQKATVSDAAKKAKKSAKETTAPPAPTEPAPQVTEPSPMAAEAVALVEKPQKKSSGDSHLFGLHADLNIPHILNYGVDYWHSSRWVSGAINFGGYSFKGLAKSSDIPNGLDIKIANQEAMFRFHPAKGSFYVGVGLGKHDITVETKQTISVTSPVVGSADVEIVDEIKANYLLPHIGWIWTWPMGLTFGLDLGYLSPVSPKVELQTNISNISNIAITRADIESTQQYKDARRDIEEKSDQAGRTGLPFWTVFRIGWLF